MDLTVANLPRPALPILTTTASTCGLGLLTGSVSLDAEGQRRFAAVGLVYVLISFGLSSRFEAQAN